MKLVLWEKNKHQIGTLTLNRPEKNNALNGALLDQLITTLEAAAKEKVRLLILRGAGQNFCAGADLQWMQQMAKADFATNQADAQKLAYVLRLLYNFPAPTILFAHGAVYGGGVGLVAAVDFALTTPNSHFCLSEIKLGLIPAVISPYLIETMGYKTVLQYALTAKPFQGEEAVAVRLCFDTVETFDSDPNSHQLIAQLLQAGPMAQALLKPWLRGITHTPGSPTTLEHKTAQFLAQLRTTPEAQEGLQAFLKKRAPSWQP